MNLDQLGQVLGPEWKLNVPAGLWYLNLEDASIEIGQGPGGGRWWVVRKHSICSQTDGWPCVDAEKAVALAQLLQVAEHLAAGTLLDEFVQRMIPLMKVSIPEEVQ